MQQPDQNTTTTTTTKPNILTIKRPTRVSYSYVQNIQGSIADIFPLYCPVRELDWVEHWDPTLVLSNSGVMEKDCIFVTKNEEDGGLEATWYVSEYDVEAGSVEMIKIVPNLIVCKLVIRVKALQVVGDNDGVTAVTEATIRYTLTALSKDGEGALKEVTKDAFDASMAAWKKAMNHYLRTGGEMLKGLPIF